MPRVDSPNYSPRPNQARPRVIVLHATGPGTVRNILDWMKLRQSKVSYHGLIAPDGTYYSVVSPEQAAWHAGVSEWNGVKNINGISLGLAFVNPNNGLVPLTPNQIAVAKGVIQYWRQNYPIEAITTHAAVATPKGRKVDPDGMIRIGGTGPLVQAVPNFRLADFA